MGLDLANKVHFFQIFLPFIEFWLDRIDQDANGEYSLTAAVLDYEFKKKTRHN